MTAPLVRLKYRESNCQRRFFFAGADEAKGKRYRNWERMNSRNFFAELKRRHVYRVAIAYGVVGWLLTQIATQVLPFFEIPSWAVRFVVTAARDGFSRGTGARLGL